VPNHPSHRCVDALVYIEMRAATVVSVSSSGAASKKAEIKNAPENVYKDTYRVMSKHLPVRSNPVRIQLIVSP